MSSDLRESIRETRMRTLSRAVLSAIERWEAESEKGNTEGDSSTDNYLVAIMLYESFDLTVIAVWETKEETKRKRQKQRRMEYMNATKEDMRRVEEQVFNYARTMKEVS